MVQEQFELLPIEYVWNYLCEQNSMPALEDDWYPEILKYEQDVLAARDES